MRSQRYFIVLFPALLAAGCPNDQPRSWYNWGGKEQTSEKAPGKGGTSSSSSADDQASTKPWSPASPEEMVIKVNEKKITVADVLKACDPEMKLIARGGSEQEWREKARPIIGEQTWRAVAESLLYGAASRGMNDETKKHVDKEVRQAEAKVLLDNGGSRRRAEEEFAKKGTTMSEAMERFRRGSTIQVYLQGELRPKVTITREMLLRYYQEHETEFRQERMVQMQIIECPFAAYLPANALASGPTDEQVSAAREQARKAVRSAQAALAAGDDFGDVAVKFSKGSRTAEKGLWPPLRAGSFRQELVEKVAFSQAEGAVSQPLETPDGLYIVKTMRILPGKLESFEDAQGRIETALINRQMNSLEKEHIQELYDRAGVVHPRGFMDEVLEQAVRKYRGGTERPPGLPMSK